MLKTYLDEVKVKRMSLTCLHINVNTKNWKELETNWNFWTVGARAVV